jgi:CheY-like chemotaxis protein
VTANNEMILDIYMPRLDGCGLLDLLRSYLRLQSLPVILFTGSVDSPLIERAGQLRVKAVLTKTEQP